MFSASTRTRFVATLLIPAAALLQNTACISSVNNDATPAFSLTSSTVPLAVDGSNPPCPQTAGASDALDAGAEISTLLLQVSARDLPSPLVTSGPFGQLTLEEIPPGKERVVTLEGRNSQGETVWRGIRSGVEVTLGATTPVDVLLTPLKHMSCARAPQESPRMFHSATALPDGRVLIAGGATTVADASALCPGCKRLSATSSLEIYDPHTGTFTPAGTMNAGRMFHTAAALPDGRIVLAGGASAVLLRPVDGDNPFPIRPEREENTVEIFDPVTGTIESLGAVVGDHRVFSAIASYPGGGVIITGGAGIPSIGVPNDLSNATNTTSICASDVPNGRVTCRAGPTMQQPHAGHISFRFSSDGADQVAVWGGLPGVRSDVERSQFQVEFLGVTPSSDAEVFYSPTLRSGEANANLFFAAAASYKNFRTAAVGGLIFNQTTQQFELSASGGNVTSWILDLLPVRDGGGQKVADGGFSRIAKFIDTNAATTTIAPRWLSALAVLDGTRALAAGGFGKVDLATDLASAIDDIALFDQGPDSAPDLKMIKNGMGLRQHRAGAAAVNVGNGTVLISGGLTVDANPSITPILPTAEIFTDPKLPSLP